MKNSVCEIFNSHKETTAQAISMEACALEYIIVGEYIIVDDNDDDEECFSSTACR